MAATVPCRRSSRTMPKLNWMTFSCSFARNCGLPQRGTGWQWNGTEPLAEFSKAREARVSLIDKSGS